MKMAHIYLMKNYTKTGQSLNTQMLGLMDLKPY
jgi:hypothetical protein